MKLFSLFAFFLPAICLGQYTQKIRGTVTDKELHTALAGVTVTITSLQPVLGAISNANGEFVIGNVPLGKHDLRFSYIGYQPYLLSGLLVNSAKETVLVIEMEEAATGMDDVLISARKEHINEMALVSARTFDVQETERYAGSRGDPARMASNFAGVQGADDSRSDIIIRGNSPQGLLWRLEEVNIPNPNHFAVPGTSGGPVSLLNNKTLGNCDFFTAAFPPEYGNSIAGVFDLRLRNGNNEKHELTAQIGLLGTELAAEGPLSRKTKASFLVTYRYATLKIFEGLHIKIGTSSVPNYQDASLKLHFPLGKKSNFNVFGIGGKSSINLIVSTLTKPSEEIYGESDRDQYFTSNTGILGASLDYNLNTKSYSKLIVAITGNSIFAHHDKVFRDPDFRLDSIKNILGYDFNTTTVTGHWYLTRKFNARQTIKAGLINDLYLLDLKDSSRQYPPSRQDWQHRLDYKGSTNLLQAYLQYKWKTGEKLTLTAGLHAQYLTHNRSKALEPRLGLRWKLRPSDVLTLGYGLHSQMQPLYQYFAHLPQYPSAAMHNYNLGFTRSHHAVAGYEHSFGHSLALRTEVYYQYLYDIPIENKPGSSFSGINQGASFSRVFPDSLFNRGTGRNYGLELTLSRTFSRGFYFLLTGSAFDSKAKGNDGILRNTDYNGKFAANCLAGYEKKLGRNSMLITGVKLTYSGGRLYSPPDITASNAIGDYVVIEAQRNSLQFPDYFRADLKLGLRINGKKLTHELAVDLVNILGTKNILSLTYSADLAAQGKYPFIKEYQLGFLPLFYYRIDFAWKQKGD